MTEEASVKFLLRKINKTINYVAEEIKHNDLINERNNKTCLILVSAVKGFVSCSEFATLVCFPLGIRSSAVGIKNCVVIAGIKNISQLQRKKEKA